MPTSPRGLMHKPPLKGEGDQRSWWRGSSVQYNFSCSHVETVRRNSLVALAVRLGLANAGGCPCLYLQCWFFEMLFVQAGNLILYGVCKLVFLGSPLGHPKGVPCAELSPQVTEGLPATAANRFHKELRFFFSLLKRKKEAKKEKSSRSTCTVRFQYHPKI